MGRSIFRNSACALSGGSHDPSGREPLVAIKLQRAHSLSADVGLGRCFLGVSSGHDVCFDESCARPLPESAETRSAFCLCRGLGILAERRISFARSKRSGDRQLLEKRVSMSSLVLCQAFYRHEFLISFCSKLH